MKNLVEILWLLVFFLAVSCGQDHSSRSVLGNAYAKKSAKEILGDKNYKPFYDTLIRTNETAIAVVEPILFDIYGRNNIVRQRPYECYLVDGYWYVAGTLPENYVGGVFEIILNAKNGEVIKLIHGK